MYEKIMDPIKGLNYLQSMSLISMIQTVQNSEVQHKYA